MGLTGGPIAWGPTGPHPLGAHRKVGRSVRSASAVRRRGLAGGVRWKARTSAVFFLVSELVLDQT